MQLSKIYFFFRIFPFSFVFWRVFKKFYIFQRISRFQTIIARNYRGDVDPSVIDRFMPILMEREEEGLTSPVLTHLDTTFVHIKHNNIYRNILPIVL